MSGTALSGVLDRLDELEAQNRRLREENEQLRERVHDLEDENQRLQERVDELESGASLEWDGGKWTEASVEAPDGTFYPIGPAIENRPTEDDLEELRERLADGDLAEDVDAGAAPNVPRETPLEDVVALPEDVAKQSLSKQDRRARFIAMDARDYGDKCPAGRIVTAGRLGRTLAAGLDVEPHPETVRRVMRRLDALGKDTTTLRKKNGEKRIIIDEDAVARLERHAEMDHADHDVVSPVEG
jgi:hypothetical protein